MVFKWNEFNIVALFSIVLYSALALTSGYYYRRLKTPPGDSMTMIPGRGQFNKSKLTFFSVLCVSAALDVPLYVGCVSMNGPQYCYWDSVSYSLCFCLHLIALVGYAVTLGIPLFLWSDLSQGRDGNMFSRKYPDFSKIFLHLSIGSYFVLQMTIILTVLITADDPGKYDSSVVRKVGALADPIVIFVIAVIWLSSGIRLQMYVVDVCFRPADERKILFTINAVMFTILCSYLLRAVMVVSLYTDYHNRSLHVLNYSYIIWTIGTRWIPYILCSFLLIFLMKRSVATVEAVSLTTSLYDPATIGDAESDGFLQTGVILDRRNKKLHDKQRKIKRQLHISQADVLQVGNSIHAPLINPVGHSGAQQRESSADYNSHSHHHTYSVNSDDYLPHASTLRQEFNSAESASYNSNSTSTYSGSAHNAAVLGGGYDAADSVYDAQYRVHSCEVSGAGGSAAGSVYGVRTGSAGDENNSHQQPQVQQQPLVSPQSTPGPVAVSRNPLIENSKDISSLLL